MFSYTSKISTNNGINERNNNVAPGGAKAFYLLCWCILILRLVARSKNRLRLVGTWLLALSSSPSGKNCS